MGLADNPALWFFPFVLPICVWVAYSDMATMKIPNKSVMALLGVFVVVGLIALPFGDFWPRLIHFAVILAVTFALNIGGVIGAGDAKFTAAAAPFVVLQDAMSVLVLFAICLIFGFITHRGARMIPAFKRATPNWESWERMKQFPMGYPLALTLAVYLAFSAWSNFA